jgi:hypothetical protein
MTLSANFSGRSRSYNPTYFRIPFSTLNYGKNYGLYIQVKASDGSGGWGDSSDGRANTRVGALPTRNSYEKSGEEVGYSSCDLPSEDLFIGVFTARLTLSGPDLSTVVLYTISVTLSAYFHPKTSSTVKNLC